MREIEKKNVILKIEEILNRSRLADGTKAGYVGRRSDLLKKIEKSVQETRQKESFWQFIDRYLREKHFVKKDGKTDYSSFYNQARISKQTWSNIRVWSEDSSTSKPKKETLLKIVFALHLDEEQAEELLNKASSSLRTDDIRDGIVVALLNLGIYDPEDVYEILEEFSIRCSPKKGERAFRNIYGE